MGKGRTGPGEIGGTRPRGWRVQVEQDDNSSSDVDVNTGFLAGIPFVNHDGLAVGEKLVSGDHACEGWDRAWAGHGHECDQVAGAG